MKQQIQQLRERVAKLQSMVGRVTSLQVAQAWGSESIERLDDAADSIEEAIEMVELLFPEE